MKCLPIDLQSFQRIREDGYAYVDKTDLIYEMTHKGIYQFLARPRRFGKSVLCDTLRCYFEGRKELFEGLKIMDLEKDWTKHPVIRLDMSGIAGTTRTFAGRLDNMFTDYEKQYGIIPAQRDDFGSRFKEIIMTAYNTTHQQVVVLIDEYDRPLQQTWNTPEHEATRALYRSVLELLKPLGDYLRFVFLTGIVKFTQLSLFSSINNLRNISFDGQYAALCGITEEELHFYYDEHVQALADANGLTKNEAYSKLKQNYDGYHFSEDNMADIYNPFSLLNALSCKKFVNFWASSGASSLLPKFVPNFNAEITRFDSHYRVLRTELETSDITSGKSALFLYQSGYLTIEGSDEYSYSLGFPNSEVREALYQMVLPALSTLQYEDVSSMQLDLRDALIAGDIEQMFVLLKAQVADIPYSNIKYAERVLHIEERYRMIITIILRALGFHVEVERMQAVGRPDIVAYVKQKVYIFELKLQNNGGAKAAAEQIRDRHYCDPFLAGTYPMPDRVFPYPTNPQVFALGIGMDDEGKGLIDYEQV